MSFKSNCCKRDFINSILSWRFCCAKELTLHVSYFKLNFCQIENTNLTLTQTYLYMPEKPQCIIFLCEVTDTLDVNPTNFFSGCQRQYFLHKIHFCWISTGTVVFWIKYFISGLTVDTPMDKNFTVFFVKKISKVYTPTEKIVPQLADPGFGQGVPQKFFLRICYCNIVKWGEWSQLISAGVQGLP